MLVYRKHSLRTQEFFQMLQYFLATIDIIAGDFNYDFLKKEVNKRLGIFTDHVQMLNKPTYTSGFMTDHVCI